MLFHIFQRLSKTKSLLLACIGGAVLTSMASTAPNSALAPQANAAIAPPPIAVVAPPEPTLADLALARYQVATKGFQLAIGGHQPGDAPGPDVLDWMRRRVRARLDIVEPKNDRVAFLKEYVDLLKKEEAFQERMVMKHLGGVQSLLRAQYDRIEGEMLLKQAEAK